MIDLSNIKNYYIACGYTDLRRGIDGLAQIVTLQYGYEIDENSHTQRCTIINRQWTVCNALSSMDNRQWALACEQWPSGNGLQAMGRGKQNATAVAQADGRAIPKGA